MIKTVLEEKGEERRKICGESLKVYVSTQHSNCFCYLLQNYVRTNDQREVLYTSSYTDVGKLGIPAHTQTETYRKIEN